MTRQMSYPGGLDFTGNNSYSYSYSYAYGTNSYSYSAPSDAAGIGGFAADPMLSAAINATRDALRSEVPLLFLGKDGDRREDKPFAKTGDELPKSSPPDIAAYGSQVRASLALFDLSSSVSFKINSVGDTATLERVRVTDQDQVTRETLVSMKRPNRAYFMGQLKDLDAWASRRDIRAVEILTQVAPPLAYFASLLNLQAGRHRRTLELVNAALQFTYAVCMQFKHALACPRPGEYSVGVQAMIEVPMHPSLPAGHAAEAHMTAAVLGALAGAAVNKDSKVDSMLRELAHRISENRVVAGLHFPIDLVAGRLLGDALASYFLARCGKNDSKWTGGKFEIEGNESNGEFGAKDGKQRFFGPGCKKLPEGTVLVEEIGLLNEMWKEAAAEWREPQ